MALRRVEFRLDHISDARVDRIRLDPLPAYGELTAAELARLGIDIASKRVPFQVTAHVEAHNPESNQVAARLIALAWSYRVDDREVLAGRLDQPLHIAPGPRTDVPILIELNLYRFFSGDARDLFETAAALAGRSSGRHDVDLWLTPRVDTPIGPMNYPDPITIRIASASREPATTH